MTHTAPRSSAAHHQKRARARRRLRQLAWASVPVWSLTLLAFAPFLWLAVIRRRRRDWALFAAYAAAVVLEIVLLPATKAKAGTIGADLTTTLTFLLMGVATVHTLVAFRPGSAIPSWRDAHAISAASKLPVRSEKLAARSEKLAARAAREDEIREKATAARAAIAEAKQERKASTMAAHTASAAAAQRKQERNASTMAAQAASVTAAQQKQERNADRTATREASAAAATQQKQERDANRAAARAASAAAATQRKQERKNERAAARAATEAARLAAPRYGWVETRRTYRSKTIFGNRRSQTIVSQPSQRNARRRTRQRFGVTVTDEWRRLD